MIDWNETYNNARQITPNAQKPGLFTQAKNFVKGGVKDAINTLIVDKGVKIGQAIASPFLMNRANQGTANEEAYNAQAQAALNQMNKTTDPQQKAALKQQAINYLNQGTQTSGGNQAFNKLNQIEQGTNIDTPVGSYSEPGLQGGTKGAEQIAGQALHSAAYLAYPYAEELGAMPSLSLPADASLTTKLLARGGYGAVVGSSAGATGSAGSAMEQGASANQVLSSAGKGALWGGVTGAGIGVATGAPDIFNRVKSIMNPDAVKAQTNLMATAQQGVTAQNLANEQVGQFETESGQKFQQGAIDLKTANPETKLNLSQGTVQGLNDARQGTKFDLPDYVNNEGSQVKVQGGGFEPGPGTNPKVLEQLGKVGQETQVSLDPVQTQDLLRRLNKAAIQAKANGDFTVNEQFIGLRNQIKAEASATFGPEWDKIYSTYHEAATAIDTVSDITNTNPKATSSQLQKQFDQIVKLGESPAGNERLMQTLQGLKAAGGPDLTEPIKVIQQMSEAQAQLEQALKPGFFKQVSNPVYWTKTIIRYAFYMYVLRKLYNLSK